MVDTSSGRKSTLKGWMDLEDATGGLADWLHKARLATDPAQFITPSDVASNLPGGGIPAAWEYSGKGRDALKEGRLGDAASAYGNMLLNTLPEGAGLAKLAAAGAAGIRAFHGSPHDFDAFDMSKIGTGEGAQAYGHGLYFAGNEDVAKGYKQALSRRNIDVSLDGQPITNWPVTVGALNKDNWRLGKLVDEYGRVGGPVEDFIRQQKDWYRGDKGMEAALEQFSQRVQSTHTPGRMYEVQINADPEHFLDWDKPHAKQTDVVKEKLKQIGIEAGDSGQQIYAAAGKGSQALREAGIPGIKYLDAGSRASGDGSRNYVVFDDKLISILRKYGWVPGAAIPAAAMKEYRDSQDKAEKS